jgi:hypothetical protein
MPRPVSGRSEAVRIRLSPVAWAYFEDLHDQLRQGNPEVQLLQGDQGVRQILSVWVEEQIREVIG